MIAHYTAEFKRLVMMRLLANPNTSIRGLANELGAPKSTIWDWQREMASVMGTMTTASEDADAKAKTVRVYSAEEKLGFVTTVVGLSAPERVAFLRLNEVTEAELEIWRSAMLASLPTPTEPAPAAPLSTAKRPSAREAKRQAQALKKAEKQLRQAYALLDLKKKWDILQGVTTPPTAEELALEAALAATEAEVIGDDEDDLLP
jgi:transposase-like protein